jgi:hypothetical protein
MSSSPHDKLAPRVRAKLEKAELRLHANPSVERAWERIFTADERDTIEAEIARAEAQDRGQAEGEPNPRWLRSNLIQWYMNVRNVSQYRATIELAHALNFLTDLDRDWLLRETGEFSGEPAPETSTHFLRPCWDRDNYVLYLGSEVIRRIKRPNAAVNIIAILDAFEEDEWPRRVDDPLRGGADPVRLAATVRSLNNGLSRIRFSKDGSGEGVTWSVLPEL